MSSETSPARLAPGTMDGHLELLDRQLLDNEGRMLGKVEDVELEERDDGRLVLTGLLTGPGALGPRLGAALDTMVTSTWARLSGRAGPARVDWSQVATIDSAVHLAVSRTTVAVDGFEDWVRDRVIAAIPGSGVKPQ